MTEILTKELYKLEDAFPNGMNQTEYRMVITLLYEDYSDRNLSDLLSTFTKKSEAEVYNDILGINEYCFENVDLFPMLCKLKEFGLI